MKYTVEDIVNDPINHIKRLANNYTIKVVAKMMREFWTQAQHFKISDLEDCKFSFKIEKEGLRYTKVFQEKHKQTIITAYNHHNISSKEYMKCLKKLAKISNTNGLSIKDRWNPKNKFGIYKGSILIREFSKNKRKVLESLNLILNWWANFKLKNIHKTTRVEVVAYVLAFYLVYETLHPFPDGNGRIGRAIMGNQLSEVFEMFGASRFFYFYENLHYDLFKLVHK